MSGHTCALTTAGGVKCWGRNSLGQLGDGTTTQRTTPVDVVGLGSGVAAVAAGDDHTCALNKTGSVKCWGLDRSGQLGTDTIETCTVYDDRCSSTPVDVCADGACVDHLSGTAAVAAGGGHTCALTTAGGVKCWGSNFSGQLGDGTTEQRTTPVDVVELSVQGDVSCDKVVNVVDVLFILQKEVGLRVDSGGCPLPPAPPDTLNVAAGDVSKDGVTNVVDALFILQCEVGIPNSFCPTED